MRLLKIVPDDTNIDFVRLRGIAFALTMLLSLAAVGVTFAKGLNFGVDFVGGLMIEETFATPPDQDQVRTIVDSLGVGRGLAPAVRRARTTSPSACRSRAARTKARPTPSSRRSRPRWARRFPARSSAAIRPCRARCRAS